MADFLTPIFERMYGARGYYIFGVLLLGLSGAAANRAAARFGQWTNAFNDINAQNTHQVYPSPFNQVWLGVRGCFWSLIYRILQFTLAILGFGLLLGQERFTNRLFKLYEQLLSVIGF